MLWGNAITCTVTHTHTDRAAKRLRHPGCRCQADAASCTAAAGDMRRCRHHRGRRLHLSALQMNAENIFLRLAAAHLTHFGRQFTFSWFLFSVCSPFLILFLFLFFFFLFVGATSGTATPAGLLHGWAAVCWCCSSWSCLASCCYFMRFAKLSINRIVCVCVCGFLWCGEVLLRGVDCCECTVLFAIADRRPYGAGSGM